MPVQLTPEEFEQQFGGGYRAAPSPVGRSGLFGAALDDTAAMALGLGEAVGLPTGGLRRDMQVQADDTRDRYYRETGDPRSFSEARGAGDVVDWGVNTAIGSAPALLAIGAGGLAGGPAGAFAAGSAFGTGDVLQNQRDQSGGTDMASALPLGIAYGAADSMLGIGGMVGRRALGTGIRSLDTAGVNLLDGLTGVKGMAARTGASMLKTGGVEAGSETFQEGMNQLGRMAVDPDETFYNSRSAENFKESAAGGGLLGAFLGGGAGGWRRSQGFRDNEQKDLLAGREREQAEQEREQAENGPRAEQVGLRGQEVGARLRAAQENRERGERPITVDSHGVGYLDAETPDARFARERWEAQQRQDSAPPLALGYDPLVGIPSRETMTAFADGTIATNEEQELAARYPNGPGPAGFSPPSGTMYGLPDGGAIADPLNQGLLNADFSQDPGAELARQRWLEQRTAAAAEQRQVQEASDASLRAEQQLQQRAASLGVPPKNPSGLKAVRMLEDVKGELTPEEYGHVEGIIRAGQFGTAADLLNKREKELMAQAKAREKAQADAAKTAQREQERAQKEAQRAQERAQKEAQRAQAPAPIPTPQEIEVANDTPAPPSSPVAGALASLRAQAAPAAPSTALTVNAPTVTAKIDGIDASKTVTVGKSGRQQTLAVADMKAKLANAPFEAKRRMLWRLGYTFDTDSATGETRILPTDGVRTLEEVAQEEEAYTGKKVSRAAIGHTMTEYGISNDVVTRTMRVSLGDDVSTADLGIDAADTEQEAKGFRVESSIAKAAGEGLIGNGEGPGKADRRWAKARMEKLRGENATDTEITAAIKGEFSPMRRQALADEVAMAMESAAPKVPEPRGLGLSEADEARLKARNDAVQAGNIARILADVEAENAALDWDGANVRYADLPDNLKADWVETYAVRVRRAGGSLTNADFDQLLVDQQNIERSYHGYNRNRDAQSTPRLGEQAATRADSPDARVSGSREVAAPGRLRDKIPGVRPGPAQDAGGTSNATSGTKPAPVEPNFDTIPDVVQRANAKWKYHKGDLTKLSDDEVTAVSDRAKKFGNATLASAANAELEARVAKKVNQDAIGPGAADAAAVNRDVTGPNVPDKTPTDTMLHFEGRAYTRDQLKDEAKKAYADARYDDVSKFNLLRAIARQGLDATRADVAASVARFADNPDYDIYDKQQAWLDSNGGKVSVAKLEARAAKKVNQDAIGPGAADAAAVNRDVTGPNVPGNGEAAQFSKATKGEGSTAAQVIADLKAFMRLGGLGNKVVVVQSVSDLPAGVQRSVNPDADTQGFVVNGKAYLVADNIAKGKARSVFLHEVGAHLGLENLLGKAQYAALVAKVKQWAAKDNGSQEHRIAKAAQQRVKDAGTDAAQADTELVAYFIEEAVDAGVDPTATKADTEFGRWFRAVWAAFKAALHKLGVNPDKLTAQDVVDMAYGAAFGWGSYFAQAPGIGKSYWKKDVANKTPTDTMLHFEGRAYTRDQLKDEAKMAYADARYDDVSKFNLLREIARQGLDATRADVAASVARFADNPDYDIYDKQQAWLDSNGGKVSVAKPEGPDGNRVSFSKAAKYAPAQEAAMQYLKVIGSKGSNGLVKMMLTSDLLANANEFLKGIPLKYKAAMDAITAEKTKQERHVADIVEEFSRLPKHEQGKGDSSVNAVLKASTMTDAWVFVPDWLPKGTVKVDPNAPLTKRFNALSKPGQALVKRVFQHGHDSLQALKAAVVDNTNSEYDAIIKELTAAGKVDEAKVERAKKAKSLENFESLMAVRAGRPYAPLRRFGKHVVMAMSARYKAAKDKGDVKLMRELESDGDHYFVAFAEGKREALRMVSELESSYPGGDVGTFEKLDMADSMMGGRDILGAMRRLRRMTAESMEDKALGAETANRVDDMMRQLYLTMLSETSARKGEIHRRNIAGANEDMMRAFSTQGVATAHFIASLKTNGKVEDHLADMRAAVSSSGLNQGERDTKQRYYNEIMRRHSLNLEFNPTPGIDKALAVSSVYMLLSNPSYFLMNAAQPWMMSHPMMAGKHGYARSAAALLQGYKDILPILKDAQFDEKSYARLPADVRAAIEVLANKGVIQIELGQELGQFKSSPDDASRVMSLALNKLKGAAQGVETLNRLSTAIAAYRLEKNRTGSAEGAIDYAAQVINETHGDYTGFNAPRFMRSGVGRIATQFRKFQLIQLSMFARLINRALKGASQEERVAARYALAYNMAHLGAIGGVAALPGFTAAAWLVGKAFGDDEPDDPRATLTRAVGKDMADLLWGGASQLLHVPVGGRIGAGNMLSILPYTDIEVTREGYAGMLMGLTGPLVGGLMPRAYDGIGMVASGDLWKGLEALSPSGVANISKGVRYQVQGLTQRNGDVALSPDEISLLDSALQAVGLPTNTIQERQYLAGAKFDAEEFYNGRTTQLKKAYSEAFRDNDAEAMREARNAWMSTQKTRRELGFTVQPLSVLLKAPQEQRKREVGMVGGVSTTKRNAGFLEALGAK